MSVSADEIAAHSDKDHGVRDVDACSFCLLRMSGTLSRISYRLKEILRSVH